MTQVTLRGGPADGRVVDVPESGISTICMPSMHPDFWGNCYYVIAGDTAELDSVIPWSLAVEQVTNSPADEGSETCDCGCDCCGSGW